MKQLLKIVRPQLGRGGLAKYISLGVLSGLCSFLFINFVTRVTGLLIAGGFTSISKEYIIVFTLIILFFIWTRWTLLQAIVKISQTLFWKLRKQIITQVLKANYQQFTKKKEDIYAAIVSDVHTLTDASTSIIEFFTASVLAIACLVYLSSISLVLFLITLGIALLGMGIYHVSSNRNSSQIETSRNLEADFIGDFNDILNGFKEIYMEPRKGKYIFENKISATANSAYKNNLAALLGFLGNQMTGQVLFYILISSVLLFFSITLKIAAADTVSFIFTLLYLLGAIETIMVLLPSLMKAGIASSHLMKLKNELETANFDNLSSGHQITKNEFRQLSVKDIEYSYTTEQASFAIGPIDMEIRKGDVIFIYGGNGSGKTTFVNVVLGLCFPSAGKISLNGVAVGKENYADYRTLFSVVFSDFHLFKEILCTGDIDMEKWNYYLRIFELDDKVKLEGRLLSTTDLSTGQRKRLALIGALLEEKPVLVIDEWAADQDPYFRRKFYTEIIPLLKDAGTTILAITHDDKYYYCADKLYKMDEGKLVKQLRDVPQIGNYVL